ncbi:hypothetical protein DY000_02021392 [Brassica cretica]|uniref:Uncharacterized protein n=1 Tax=Brassica cretica TaxID=69181 RepID=A0ABQ7E8X2_BRACR|nr:hypothetical protein DY000_02021392 [Brassica cretica]
MLNGLQYLVGIFVLSYERGMILNSDNLGVLLAPVAIPKLRMCQTNILPLFPEDILTVGNILWGGPYFWGHFSLECVPRAVAYNRSRIQPDLPVEEELEMDMEEFVPYDIPGERERSRSPKNKKIVVGVKIGYDKIKVRNFP